ncbi:hypothetical protein NUW54_g5701 [Trametes sanguinea]|uniref:Uncharacterized protein n=1 Tax=Trametes sanguinea TaxID=158606 RepID=A0ACC1PXR8_9APHY|nr:hypothetical protein NUW54_g5701 [Trametes sanguinea]
MRRIFDRRRTLASPGLARLCSLQACSTTVLAVKSELGSPKKSVKLRCVAAPESRRAQLLRTYRTVPDDDDDDEQERGRGEFKASKREKDSDAEDDDDDDEPAASSKKRKKAPGKAGKPAKKAKKSDGDDEDEDDVEGVRIEMNQAVTLTFSLKYLVNFAKSAALSKKVQLMMSNDVPLLVSLSLSPRVVCAQTLTRARARGRRPPTSRARAVRGAAATPAPSGTARSRPSLRPVRALARRAEHVQPARLAVEADLLVLVQAQLPDRDRDLVLAALLRLRLCLPRCARRRLCPVAPQRRARGRRRRRAPRAGVLPFTSA